MKQKNVLLGITASIAAYKACDLINLLKQNGYLVKAVMTQNACKLIGPITIQSLTANPVYPVRKEAPSRGPKRKTTKRVWEEFRIPSKLSNGVYIEMFKDTISFNEEIEHISLAKWCDLLAIVPATGNIIGKIANGIADDLLSTVFMALPKNTPVVIAPAMNTNMWFNKFLQKNIKILQEESVKIKGNSLAKYTIVPPRKGSLACGDEGKGALANVDDIFKKIKEIVSKL